MTENREAAREIGFQNGFFRFKQKRGVASCYFTFPRALDSQCVYVGQDSTEMRGLVERFHQGKQEAAEYNAEIRRVAKMLTGAGINHLDIESFRVIDSFAQGGLFRLGGVLVGTHAFNIIGNTLGLQWVHQTSHTQDVDFAKGSVKFASNRTTETREKFSVPDRLNMLEMGLTPVPALDLRMPSTSYSNKKGFRVDFRVPLVGKKVRPYLIRDFNVGAQLVRFLDFLIEETFETTAISTIGSIKVTVPHPARFAFHKLIVAAERSITEEPKAVKDIHQAWQLFEVLMERRPDDLHEAFTALTDPLKERGLGWLKRVQKGLMRMDYQKQEVAERLRKQFPFN